MYFDYSVIDIHTHLRNDISRHTKIAKESGIDVVVYMANSDPPLDSLERIQHSREAERHCQALPVSAITKNLAGRVLVDVDKIKPYVVGFSDDGRHLADLDLLREILRKGVLVMAHCSPPYEIGVKNPGSETKIIGAHLNVLEEVGGNLHIQHVSQKASVDLIRKAKAQGLPITCETCPHYCFYTSGELNVEVNPPLATAEDVRAVREGLDDGTIDVIASDYAPLPRKTGIAGFHSFLPLSFGLVIQGVLSPEQLREKISENPRKIIESGGYKLNM